MSKAWNRLQPLGVWTMRAWRNEGGVYLVRALGRKWWTVTASLELERADCTRLGSCYATDAVTRDLVARLQRRWLESFPQALQVAVDLAQQDGATLLIETPSSWPVGRLRGALSRRATNALLAAQSEDVDVWIGGDMIATSHWRRSTAGLHRLYARTA